LWQLSSSSWKVELSLSPSQMSHMQLVLLVSSLRLLGFHWEAINLIIRHMKRAPGLGILYRPNEHFKVEGFTDVNWASSPSNRLSTTRYFTFLDSNLVT